VDFVVSAMPVRPTSEPFCGPLLPNLKNLPEIIDGSAVAAFKKSMEVGCPYTSMHVGDAHGDA